MKQLIFGLLLNSILFFLIHWIHFTAFHPKIIFTAALFDAGLACCLGSIIIYFLTKKLVLTASTFLIVFLAATNYITLIPTMVDRSITVFILLNLNQAASKGVDIRSLKQQLQNERIINKRFEELSDLGIIHIQNNRVYLSKNGVLSAKIFLYDMKIFKLDKEYTNFALPPKQQ